MGLVTALISGKGGTGKTTLCAALAGCMAAEGKRVLCVDLDVGLRNLDLALGLGQEPVLPFTQASAGFLRLEDLPEHPRIPGLFLLSAPERAEQAELDALDALLCRAREQFDEILLDGPAGLGTLFRLGVHCSDRVLLISGADPASMRDAAQTAQQLEISGCCEAWLVLNRVQKGYFRRTGQTVDDMMDQVGLPLLGLVPEDGQVSLAAARNSALVLFERRGAAPACLRIARRLDGRRVPLAIT